MKKFWYNLPFFWKVYISAIILIISVVFVAEWSEDVIPYLTDFKGMNRPELEKLLDEYIESGASHAEWHDKMKEQNLWLLDIPLTALGGWVDDEKELQHFSVLDFLPESDDWTDEWIIVERISPDGRLVALGLDEPAYTEALDAVLWGSVIALFAGIACYYLSKFLTSRLRGISSAAQQLARGDLGSRVEVEAEGGDDLAALGRMFNRMVESVGIVVENERRLLYDISHELRSPLARMSLSLDLIRRLDKEQSKKYMDLLHGDIERMTNIMNALMEQGKSSFATDDLLDDFDINELLDEIVSLAGFEFEKSGKKVKCKLISSLPPRFMFSGSRSLFEQVIYNLLSNALRYAPEGSEVELIAVPGYSQAGDAGGLGSDRLIITVRDYGPGVPEEYLESIFRPFFRVDSSRNEHSGGAGLGLALVAQYVKRHRGELSAFNASPGLAVRVSFPAGGVPVSASLAE